MLATLKEEQLVSNEQIKMPNHNFRGVAQELFNNQMVNPDSEDKHGYHFTTDMKQFAMTWHYYSPKAYNFVRNVLSLPHPSCIRTWASTVDCEPGYLANIIKLLGEAAKKQPLMKDVVLVVDVMTLHKGTT